MKHNRGMRLWLYSKPAEKEEKKVKNLNMWVSRKETNRLHDVVIKKRRGNKKHERVESIAMELGRQLKAAERAVEPVTDDSWVNDFVPTEERMAIETIWTDTNAWVEWMAREEEVKTIE